MSVNIDYYHDKFQIIISFVNAVETSKLWFYHQNMTNACQTFHKLILYFVS